METLSKKTMRKKFICSALALTLASVSVFGADFNFVKEVKAENVRNAANVYGVKMAGNETPAGNVGNTVKAVITGELTAKRTKFVKQFAMSDGSFTAASYSMPVNYKKNGRWIEIDTTLKKSGKKYKTKSTDLNIQVSGKSNNKPLVSLKRGSAVLSIALNSKKLKSSNVKISNPKKKLKTDVLNSNRAVYKNVLKNTGISYDIFPEKVQEILTVGKKQKNKSFSFKLNSGNLKVKVKGRKVFFKTKQGKTKFTRMNTVITDANGVSVSKVKLSYNKKKKILKVTPDKKWWNSRKRKFPMEIRTTYTTDRHERDVKVGAAYAGASDSNFGYNKFLLIQANKCVAFTKMSILSELKDENVFIRDAALHISNEKTLSLGAGKTFDIGVHKVEGNWNANKLTYNNRPAYVSDASATVCLQKAGRYECDVTDIVKSWYLGEPNYGVALTADNSNRSYQAKLDRNPYFTVHYEVVGFEGARELKASETVSCSVVSSAQENFYYFDAKQGIAYDIYTDSSVDTQASMYDENKENVGYDDNSGLGRNFLFTGSYDGRRYIKVSIKDKGLGDYALHMEERFAVPEPVGVKGSEKYTVKWKPVKKAKEYLVCVYGSGGKIDEAVVRDTFYDYVYTGETLGRSLGFTVTAMENEKLMGEASRMIFNEDVKSEWTYAAPMAEKRKNFSAVASDGKVYVLGGENETGALNGFAVYDTKEDKWDALPDYGGADLGICRAAMFAYGDEVYVIGGQTGTGENVKLLTGVYAFNTKTGQWQKKSDMAAGRTNTATALCGGKAYMWTKAGGTDKLEIYDIKADAWEVSILPETSSIIDAVSVDGHVFVLKEAGDKMCWSEYLTGDGVFEDEGAVCPYAFSDRYRAFAGNGGKIYMIKEAETKEVLVYDVYTDEWGQVSPMNLMKKDSVPVACGSELYSIGGEMAGFGVTDVVERYTAGLQTVTRELSVKKGENYELQLAAGNLKRGQAKTVTLNVKPDEAVISNPSSFEDEEVLAKGVYGVKLLKYNPKKGVIVFKLSGSLEQGETYEVCQSVTVEAKISGKIKVGMSVE